MPPVAKTRPGEIIYTITRNGKPVSGAMVFLTPAEGQAAEPIGVRADRMGKAWFLVSQPGKYVMTVEGTDPRREVRLQRLPNTIEAGFGYIPRAEIRID